MSAASSACDMITELEKQIEELTTEYEEKLATIKQAFSDYTRSEGCDCCSNPVAHEAAENILCTELGFNRYEDDSGWDKEWFQ